MLFSVATLELEPVGQFFGQPDLTNLIVGRYCRGDLNLKELNGEPGGVPIGSAVDNLTEGVV